MTRHANCRRIRAVRTIRWFVTVCVIAVVLNFVPLVVTWRAYRWDGKEQIGFPFVFFEQGGFSFSSSFYLGAFVADVMTLLACSTFAAYLLRDGWQAAMDRMLSDKRDAS